MFSCIPLILFLVEWIISRVLSGIFYQRLKVNFLLRSLCFSHRNKNVEQIFAPLFPPRDFDKTPHCQHSLRSAAGSPKPIIPLNHSKFLPPRPHNAIGLFQQELEQLQNMLTHRGIGCSPPRLTLLLLMSFHFSQPKQQSDFAEVESSLGFSSSQKYPGRSLPLGGRGGGRCVRGGGVLFCRTRGIHRPSFDSPSLCKHPRGLWGFHMSNMCSPTGAEVRQGTLGT